MIDSVQIKNLDEIRKQFAAAPRIIEEELQQAVEGELRAMAQALAIYPGQRPRQRYKRTGRLGRGWTERKPAFTRSSAGIAATLRNPVSYAPFVQSAGSQAWFHRGRWVNTVEAEQLAFAGSNMAALERAANNAAKRIDRGG